MSSSTMTNTKIFVNPLDGGSILNGLNCTSTLGETILEAATLFFPWYRPINQLTKTHLNFDLYWLGAVLVFVLILGAIWRGILYSWASIGSYVVEWTTSQIILPDHDQIYQEVIQKLSSEYTAKKSWFSDGARSLNLVSAKPWDEENPSSIISNIDGNDTSASIRYDPSLKTVSWFFYHWNIIFIQELEDPKRETLSRSHHAYTTNAKKTMILRCFGARTEPLRAFIDECRLHAKKAKSVMTVLHKVKAGWDWKQTFVRPTRSLATIDIDQDQKQALIDDLMKYLRPAERRFYARRGVPYRRGYLFYGPPGTGKTSMSLALAGTFGLELYALSLHKWQAGDSGLQDIFDRIPPKCIVLLEDIDSAGVKREDMKNKKKPPPPPQDDESGNNSDNDGHEASNITLSGLLNVIDGVSSQEGRVLIMTTNNRDALDPALIRDGRVDLQIFFGPMSQESAERMFKRMYAKDPDDFDTAEEKLNARSIDLIAIGLSETKVALPGTPNSLMKRFTETYTDEGIQDLARNFASYIPEGMLTPAEVQGYLLTKAEDPSAAVAEVAQWVRKIIAKKEADMAKKEEKRKAKSAKRNADLVIDDAAKAETLFVPVHLGEQTATPRGYNLRRRH